MAKQTDYDSWVKERLNVNSAKEYLGRDLTTDEVQYLSDEWNRQEHDQAGGMIRALQNLKTQRDQGLNDISVTFKETMGRDPNAEELNSLEKDYFPSTLKPIDPVRISKGVDLIKKTIETTAPAVPTIADLTDKYNLSPDEAKIVQDKLKTGDQTGVEDILGKRTTNYGDIYKTEMGVDAPTDIVQYAKDNNLDPFTFRILVKSTPEYADKKIEEEAAKTADEQAKQKGLREEARDKFIAEQTPILAERAKAREAKSTAALGPMGTQADIARKQFGQGLDEQTSGAVNSLVQSMARVQPYGGSALPVGASNIYAQGVKARAGLEGDLSSNLLSYMEADRQRRLALGEQEKSLLDQVAYTGLEQENLLNAGQGSDLLKSLWAAEMGTLGQNYSTAQTNANQSFQERLANAQNTAATNLSNLGYNQSLNSAYINNVYNRQNQTLEESIISRYLANQGGSKNNLFANMLSGAGSGATVGATAGGPWGALWGGLAGAGMGAGATYSDRR